jgi:hypothetical protein
VCAQHVCGRHAGETIDAFSAELECPWDDHVVMAEMLAIVEYELKFRGGTDGEYCAPGRVVSGR